MKKFYGMTMKDWQILSKMLNQPKAESKFKTVKEYITLNPQSVTNRRVSSKGTEIIEVTYPSGKVAEYPIEHISSTTAFFN